MIINRTNYLVLLVAIASWLLSGSAYATVMVLQRLPAMGAYCALAVLGATIVSAGGILYSGFAFATRLRRVAIDHPAALLIAGSAQSFSISTVITTILSADATTGSAMALVGSAAVACSELIRRRMVSPLATVGFLLTISGSLVMRGDTFINVQTTLLLAASYTISYHTRLRISRTGRHAELITTVAIMGCGAAVAALFLIATGATILPATVDFSILAALTWLGVAPTALGLTFRQILLVRSSVLLVEAMELTKPLATALVTCMAGLVVAVPPVTTNPLFWGGLTVTCLGAATIAYSTHRSGKE